MSLRRDRLRELRQKKGLTQEELAERLHLGRRQIHRYEKGLSEPSGDVVSRIAVEFNVSTDYLLGLTSEIIQRLDELQPEEIKLVYAFRRRDLTGITEIFARRWQIRPYSGRKED